MGSLRVGAMSIVWLGLISQLFFHLVDSRILQGEMLLDDQIRSSSGQHPHQSKSHIVISNGVVNMTLTVPDGQVSSISYKGTDNLLNTEDKEDNRVYWDMTWKFPGINEKLIGMDYKIVEKNEQQIEISFTTTWKKGWEAPLNIDKRFVLLKDSPGFYSYMVVEHLEGWPALTIQQARIVLKLQEKFHYMAMSDAIQRIMPTAGDRNTGQVLDFKEAVLFTHPTNPNLQGEVDDKYFYSHDNKDNEVHGWVGDDIGIWMITPSNEFRAGGPFKQGLTSHVGPTMLNMFTSTHYTGESLAISVESSNHWKMVWGPIFVYLNSDPSAKDNPSKLWDDAKRKAQEEASSWPYAFPLSKDFLKSNERGTVKGRLLVHDWLENKTVVPTGSTYVGLAQPREVGSWQYDNKGYQFWSKTDKEGNFLIKNVIPGKYGLYATVNGILGDFKHATNITISKGATAEAKDVVFEAPRNGPTLWEIGIPDRTAAEFFIPDPSPRFKLHKFPKPIEKFREYGLWARYADFYPKEDLVFTIGKSNYKRDWFFMQVNRESSGYFQPTTWKIVFDLENVEKEANYTLQLAIAGALSAELQVHINTPPDRSRPYFSTGRVGEENIIARHGIHGLYRSYSIVISGNVLANGENIIFLRQSKANGPFVGIMYDYIRFEGPAPNPIMY